jgi:hypothetical protein
MRWYKENERYLVNRKPVATVGVLWSQRNSDFYGRNDAVDRVDAPYSGFMHALVRARIPYLPVHIDDVDREDQRFKLLIVPNVAAMSDEQAAALRRFVAAGGSLLATGQTSLYDEWGDPRPDFALADVLGVRHQGSPPKLGGTSERQRGTRDRFAPDVHTYLRLTPELRAKVDGPEAGDEPPATGSRHPVLEGFDKTDILPYGGTLSALRVDEGAMVPLTFIPPFPTYPPETAWMRQAKTNIPGLVLSQRGKSRIAYMPADLDRRYYQEHLPDHATLLANIVRWAASDEIPLSVEGPGLIDCHLYTQEGKTILHLVNLTSAATWRAPLDELIPVGPVKVRVRVNGQADRNARLLVSKATRTVSMTAGMAVFEMPSILDHEVVVL